MKSQTSPWNQVEEGGLTSGWGCNDILIPGSGKGVGKRAY